MTSTSAPLRMTVMAKGRPIASANMSRCRSCAFSTGLPAAVSSRSPARRPPVGRAAGHYLAHPQAACAAEPLLHRGGQRRGHADQPEVGTPDLAVPHQGRDDPP